MNHWSGSQALVCLRLPPLPRPLPRAGAGERTRGGSAARQGRGEFFFFSFLRVGPSLEIRARGVINSWVHSTLKFLRVLPAHQEVLGQRAPRAAPAAARPCLVPPGDGGREASGRTSRRGSCHYRRTRKHRTEVPIISSPCPSWLSVGPEAMGISNGWFSDRWRRVNFALRALYHLATHNKRMKEQVALELQFVNSNLQLLKEQLAELNSSVEVYQGTQSKGNIPMIPLGLKETKEIDFREPFKDFILEHYSEEPDKYDEPITEFMDLRGAMRTPERDDSGVGLLFEYFNQLYFIDRRFFPPDRSLGIYFEWYDSLTGTPSCQRTVAFEKACVLFNLGALYTQLGARHDRTSAAGLDAAVNNFLRAAGMFRYLHDTFTNAPSKDLSPEILDMLIHLMLAQARECLHEKALLGHSEDFETVVELSQEAANVAQEYAQVLKTISDPAVKGYVPASWISLVHIKADYYRACSHYHIAEALLTLPCSIKEEEHIGMRVREALQYFHLQPSNNTTTIDITVPSCRRERTILGLAHCREAVLVHEEAMRQHRMCRDLKKKSVLAEVLQIGHETAVHLLDLYVEEEDLLNILDPPPISPATKVQLSLTTPDFSQHRVEDLFKLLGPVAVFSAKHQWSAPRPIKLTRTPTQGFGFSVRGDAPVVIAGVDRNSLAERAGINEGDLVVCIGTRDVKWMPHDEVVGLIREAGNTLNLTLVTPCDKTYYKLPKKHC
ncbi:putative rhophilin-2 isoform X1 [Penaeus vannamei]|uniref:Putative rhophilin-2 isoform X1 n=1 Tax=Penaeus vannamei TaxID=6689 RepID=A0A3R7PVM3_PENVA|nr:putative rhophilin-2 isoform X1 [Penaeus vannamei]